MNASLSFCRLYKTVEDYDVLLGIFSGKLGTQPITQKAIEAEARADYSTARKLYEEVGVELCLCKDTWLARPVVQDIWKYFTCRRCKCWLWFEVSSERGRVGA